MEYTIKQSPDDFMVNEMIELKTDKIGKYSYFLLKKRDCNTEDAIRNVAEDFRIDRKRINACGNKDKVAVTTQYISVDGIPTSLRKDHDLGDVKLHYLGQGHERLNLGSHLGNRFRIVVRGVPEDFIITKDLRKVKNLFGEQRFSNNNAEIGRAIVKKDFKKAVELMIENRGSHEKEVEAFLHESPNDYIGALRTIPKKIMSLYVHSYQSFLFNRVAETIDCEENILIPLIGFGTEAEGKAKEAIESIMQEEEIIGRDFIIRQFPEISSEGEQRHLYMQVDNFNAEKGKDFYVLEFELGKGSYATTVIEYLFGQ